MFQSLNFQFVKIVDTGYGIYKFLRYKKIK